MGDLPPGAKPPESVGYKLTGITEVGDAIPIHKLIDRNWPAYDYPGPLKDGMMENYRAWNASGRGATTRSCWCGRRSGIRRSRGRRHSESAGRRRAPVARRGDAGGAGGGPGGRGGAEPAAALRPRVQVFSVWSPGPRVLLRLLSERLYPGPRDIFATNMSEANEIVVAEIARLKSWHGHIVVRVEPGGDTYRVIILDGGTGSERPDWRGERSVCPRVLRGVSARR